MYIKIVEITKSNNEMELLKICDTNNSTKVSFKVYVLICK